MPYSLDTNICVRILRGNSPKLLARISSIAPGEIFVCAITRAELLYGAEKSNRPVETLEKLLNFLKPFPTLPFDDKAAQVAGIERARLEAIGLPVGPYDLLIASIALANDVILVTHNTREFSRIVGLKIEDWEE
jgi:tRNA(fMet)-specific endonuclease VapC